MLSWTGDATHGRVKPASWLQPEASPHITTMHLLVAWIVYPYPDEAHESQARPLQ